MPESQEQPEQLFSLLSGLPGPLRFKILACLDKKSLLSVFQASKALATEVFAVAPRCLRVRLSPKQQVNHQARQSVLTWCCTVFNSIHLKAVPGGENSNYYSKYIRWYDGEVLEFDRCCYGSVSTDWTHQLLGASSSPPDEDLQSFPPPAVFPSVTRLHLEGLTLESLLPPAAATALPNLHTVEVRGCYFRSQPVTQPPVCPSVSTVRFIGTQGLSHLSNNSLALMFPNLTHLTVLTCEPHDQHVMAFEIPDSVTHLEIDRCMCFNATDKWAHVQQLTVRCITRHPITDPTYQPVIFYSPYTSLGHGTSANELLCSLTQFSAPHVQLCDMLMRVLLDASYLEHVTVGSVMLDECHRMHCSWKSLTVHDKHVDLVQLARLPLAWIGEVVLGGGQDVILDIGLLSKDDHTGVQQLMGHVHEALMSVQAASKVRCGERMLQVDGQLTLTCAYARTWEQQSAWQWESVPQYDWRECPRDARIASVVQAVASIFKPVHSLCLRALRVGHCTASAVAQFAGHSLHNLHVLDCGNEGSGCIWTEAVKQLPQLRQLRFEGLQGLLLKDLAGLCAGTSPGLEVHVQQWPKRVAKLLPSLRSKVSGAKVARQLGGVLVQAGVGQRQSLGHPGLLLPASMY